MIEPATSLPGRQIVTSSDFVRHFGYWQECAGRAPVYILHRGRPRLVLTSVDIMDALCAPHLAAGAEDADRGAIDDALLATGTVAAAWIDARGFLETGARALASLCAQNVESLADLPFATLFGVRSRSVVGQAIEDVISTGKSLRIKVLLFGNRSTPLTVQIGLAPRRSGFAIHGVIAILTAAEAD